MAIDPTKQDLLISLGRLDRFKTSLAPVALSGSYDDLTGKPSIPNNNNQLTNGAGYQTAAQVQTAIDEATSQIDTTIYILVAALPDVADADTQKIYVLTTDGTEWRSDGANWDNIGLVQADLEGVLTDNDLATDDDIDALFE
ncbi:MAG: hypothetical protein LBJ11_09190 [Oscillospiraceae bacterium]|jgi:hypothetical protein|nr:hypothetical protein [Oscillospiraceae bacterium]